MEWKRCNSAASRWCACSCDIYICPDVVHVAEFLRDGKIDQQTADDAKESALEVRLDQAVATKQANSPPSRIMLQSSEDVCCGLWA